MITLGAKSLAEMSLVHPDLKRVIKRAAQLALPSQDFTIIQGARNKEQMWTNWGKGRTSAQCQAKGVPLKYSRPELPKVTWLNDPLMSNHRIMPDGWAHAVDMAPWPIVWSDYARFRELYHLMISAAHIEKVRVRCGWDWDGDGVLGEKGETDIGHYELVV